MGRMLRHGETISEKVESISFTTRCHGITTEPVDNGASSCGFTCCVPVHEMLTEYGLRLMAQQFVLLM